jgi:hypothetical protein
MTDFSCFARWECGAVRGEGEPSVLRSGGTLTGAGRDRQDDFAIIPDIRAGHRKRPGLLAQLTSEFDPYSTNDIG